MAITIPKVKHLVGTNKIVTLPDVYSEITDITGISKMEDDPPDDAETYKSPVALAATGIVRAIHVKLSNGKLRTIYIVAANAPKIGGLLGKEYLSGITIKTAYFPGTFKYG